MPTQMLEAHWVILYFVYGQVFFIMGLVTGLQWRRRSRLELARSLPWLAAFGLLHSLVEWGYIFIPMEAGHLYGDSALAGFGILNYILVPLQGRYDLPPVVVLMVVIHLLLLALSFFCLFQFGVELRLSPAAASRRRWLRAVPGVALALWLAAIALWAFLGDAPLNVLVATADGWSRYFMAFPGAILAFLGLLRQARQVRGMGLTRIADFLSGAAIGFAFYGAVGGLIVPVAGYFPANTLNYELLNRTIQVPAPVFRSLCGIAIAFFVVRSLEVFEAETEHLIADMERRQLIAADRERIGRELHDGIIQSIFSAGLMLEDASHLVHDEPGLARDRIRTVMGTLDQSITDIRSYVYDLQSAAPPRELRTILRKLVDDLRLDTLLEVNLQMTEHCHKQLTPQQTAHLTQIAREALSNIVQHADAHHVAITLSCTDDNVRLTVADDGRGLDSTRQIHPGHEGHGIGNMQTRAQLLGGQFAMESTPGHGVQLTVVAPFSGGDGGNGKQREESLS